MKSAASHLVLVDVWNGADGRRNHADRTPSKQLALVIDQLSEETGIRTDDRTARLDVSVRVLEVHALVFHEIRDADARRPADPGHAVDESATSAVLVRFDLVGAAVEVDVDARLRCVVDAHLHRLDARDVDVRKVNRAVDDEVDPVAAHLLRRHGRCSAQVEVIVDLGHLREYRHLIGWTSSIDYTNK